MSEAFRGEYEQKLDAKGRLLVPAAFRRLLDAGYVRTTDNPRTRMVIVYGGNSRQFCECYSYLEAENLASQIKQLPDGTKYRLRLERDMITRSAEIEIDDDGRIILPVKARMKLGIEGVIPKDGVELVLAGETKRFKLWRADTYVSAQNDEDDEDDDMDPLALLSAHSGRLSAGA